MKNEFRVPRKKLHKYWKAFCIIHNDFYKKVGLLEKVMSKELGIKNMEFFNSDIGWCGIGNADRTMKLEQFDPE